MNRPTKVTKEQLEFIEELAERFPDLPDHEVLNAYSEYSGKVFYNKETIEGRIILYAYERGAEVAMDYALTVWGTSVRSD